MFVKSTNYAFAIDMRDKRKYAMKNALKMMVLFVLMLIGFLGVVIAYLVYPGTKRI